MEESTNTPEGSASGSKATAEKQGLSTGAKVAIGCGGLVLLGIAVVGVMAVFAVGWAGDRVGDFVDQAEHQVVAEETLQRVREEHPFERPPDEVVREDQARTFFAITDDLWAEMEPWAEDLQAMAQRLEEQDDPPSLSDMAASFEGVSRFMEGRAIFARTLEDHGMSPAEYVWTGFSLARAHEEWGREEGRRVVPEENLALAETFDSEIRALVDPPEEEEVTRGILLTTSMVWGAAGGDFFHAMGLDTIYADPVP